MTSLNWTGQIKAQSPHRRQITEISPLAIRATYEEHLRGQWPILSFCSRRSSFHISSFNQLDIFGYFLVRRSLLPKLSSDSNLTKSKQEPSEQKRYGKRENTSKWRDSPTVESFRSTFGVLTANVKPRLVVCGKRLEVSRHLAFYIDFRLKKKK